jgi:hypothetical protein
MARKRETRQPRRGRDEWARLFSEQAESGLSQRAFCESRHLSVSTFCNAKRRAGAAARDGAPGIGGDFIPIIFDTETSEPATERWNIELDLGSGVVLRIRSV